MHRVCALSFLKFVDFISVVFENIFAYYIMVEFYTRWSKSEIYNFLNIFFSQEIEKIGASCDTELVVIQH